MQVRSGRQRLAKANRIIAYFAPNYKKMPLHMHEKANRAAAAYRSVRQNAPVCGDNCYTPGNEFAALLQCALDGVFNAAAAGGLARHGHALDIVFTQDGGELFRVVALIQLGASDERYAAADEILVKRTVGVRGAVRRDEQRRAP